MAVAAAAPAVAIPATLATFLAVFILGGSFDVYTGNVKRAPYWWVKNNLEWAYRLVSQPSRIKRQIHLLRFIVNLHLNRY